jgi:hypothetical protein
MFERTTSRRLRDSRPSTLAAGHEKLLTPSRSQLNRREVPLMEESAPGAGITDPPSVPVWRFTMQPNSPVAFIGALLVAFAPVVALLVSLFTHITQSSAV